MDNVIFVLTEAREKLRVGWCQNHMAQTRTRETCSPHQSKARRFCLMGALIGVAKNDELLREAREEARLALVQALRKRYKSHVTISAFNDHSERTLEEVLELIDEAVDIVNNRSTGNHETTSAGPPTTDQLQRRYAALGAGNGAKAIPR